MIIKFILLFMPIFSIQGELKFDDNGNLLDDGLKAVLSKPGSVELPIESDKVMAQNETSKDSKESDEDDDSDKKLSKKRKEKKENITIEDHTMKPSKGSPNADEVKAETVDEDEEEDDEIGLSIAEQTNKFPSADEVKGVTDDEEIVQVVKKRPRRRKAGTTFSSPLVAAKSVSKVTMKVEDDCNDKEGIECDKFKPLCNILGKLAYTNCKKTCNLCNGNAAKVVTAKLKNLGGQITIKQDSPCQPTHLTACFDENKIKSLTSVGMIIHVPGPDKNSCSILGGHWNPYGSFHGSPHNEGSHHYGDMGNILFNSSENTIPKDWIWENDKCPEDKVGFYAIYNQFSIFENNPKGLWLVVHKNRDDLGRNFLDEESRKTGHVGKALSCGKIVEITHDNQEKLLEVEEEEEEEEEAEEASQTDIAETGDAEAVAAESKNVKGMKTGLNEPSPVPQVEAVSVVDPATTQEISSPDPNIGNSTVEGTINSPTQIHDINADKVEAPAITNKITNMNNKTGSQVINLKSTQVAAVPSDPNPVKAPFEAPVAANPINQAAAPQIVVASDNNNNLNAEEVVQGTVSTATPVKHKAKLKKAKKVKTPPAPSPVAQQG